MATTPSTSAAAASSFPPVQRREIFGWCCFDFANSAFTTVIITVVYSIYFQKVVAGGAPAALGWWGTVLAVSQLAVVLLSPVLGAVADVRAQKKRFLLVSALVCGTATAALAWAGPGDVWLALGLVALANFAFSLSENFCAAFLPEISTPATAGRISGYGWSFGYLGGLLSLVLALVIIGSGEGRVPWTFVMTGAFFLLGTTPTLLLLRERAVPRRLPAGESYLAAGWRANLQLLRELPQHRTLAVFFCGMTLYLAGLTAIIAFAAVFAGAVLGFTQNETILLFIVLQVAGVAGAFGFGFVQDKLGAKVALVASLILWIGVCGWAALCQTKTEFYVIGVLAGIGIGSLQSAGRAVVSTLTPAGRGGEFFGFWGFFAKIAAVIGQPAFGWIAAASGQRVAVGATALFFLAGLIVVARLDLRPRAVPVPVPQ